MVKAQGTVEYLVILAVIVIIALVAVFIILNSTEFGNSSSDTGSKINQSSRAGISVVNSYLNPDGNVILVLKNRTEQFAEIMQVGINEEFYQDYCSDNQLKLNEEGVFVLKVNEYTCKTGEKIKAKIQVKLDNKTVRKTELIDVDLECTEIEVEQRIANPC
jgi:hypothetical protein